MRRFVAKPGVGRKESAAPWSRSVQLPLVEEGAAREGKENEGKANAGKAMR